jgi:hypothetical protein
MRRRKCVICKENYIDEQYTEFHICNDCLDKVVPKIIKKDSNLMHWTMIFLINIWSHGFDTAINLMKKKNEKKDNNTAK